jgi:hypothetical protein
MRKIKKWKPRWWARSTVTSFSQHCVQFQTAFRSQLATGSLAIDWTHEIVVESNHVTGRDHFCGEAGYVEIISFGGNQSRLAVFWTGRLEPKNVFYGQLPSDFVLMPSIRHLVQVARSVLEKRSIKMVDSCDNGCPKKGEVWLSVDEGEASVTIHFECLAVMQRLEWHLEQAGLMFDGDDENATLIIKQEDNRD